MSSNLLLWGFIGIALLGAAAGGALYFASQNNEGTNDEATENTGDENRLARSFTGTMADVYARGEAKCTFTHTTDAGTSNGTVYVANGKMRGDFTSVMGGTTVESHMISDSEFMYTWSPMSPQGFKMAMDGDGQVSTGSGSQDYWNQSLNYDCDSWSADESLFVAPTNIQFMEMAMPSASMQGQINAGVPELR